MASHERPGITASLRLTECVFSLRQCEENASLADCSRYLKLPFSKNNLPSNNQILKGTKESFWITSFLCSTKLTQNGNIPTHKRTFEASG